MPVKIQELIIQTKVKTGNNAGGNNMPAKGNHQQELKSFERQLRQKCLEDTKNLLQEQQER